MEITFYEDPACSWCWAFQPVSTAFSFEFGDVIHPRHVMGGLRDRPAADVGFLTQQWKKAEDVSGMPFDARSLKKHILRTTFVACRAVKAASMISEMAAHRLLRRLREAQFVELTPIDDLQTVLHLAAEVGINPEQLGDNISSGRAEALFARDRAEAAQYGFGFPTIVLRNGAIDTPIVLQGAVPYSDLVQALFAIGVSPRQRLRFRDTPEHWATIFQIHPRLTLAELQRVTQIDKGKLIARLQELGIRLVGAFYELAEWRHPVEFPRAPTPAPAAHGASTGSPPEIASEVAPEVVGDTQESGEPAAGDAGPAEEAEKTPPCRPQRQRRKVRPPPASVCPEPSPSTPPHEPDSPVAATKTV